MPGKWGGARRARPPLDPPMMSLVDPRGGVPGTGALNSRMGANY